ncbi:MAG: tetratricopeptide repeat protein [Acidobacteriota bacterium]
MPDHGSFQSYDAGSLRVPRSDRWLLALLLLATFLLYLGSLPKEFTNWDDGTYVVNNPLIRSFSLSNLNKIVTEPYFANYAPLTLLSYALDYQLWELNAAGYHFHNVALHLACVVALFVLLQHFGLPKAVVWLTTVLFALHPINVESVSWTSERKNLLATLFFFLSFDHYIRFTKQKRPIHYLTSLLFFLLSLLSKASTIVGPLAFLAYDYAFSSKRIRDLKLYDKLPFFIASEVLAFLSIHAAGAGSALTSYHRGGAALSLFASGFLFGEYLKLLLWPVELTAIIYPSRDPSWGDLWIWAAIAAFGAAAVLTYRASRQAFFWLSFFVIFLIPVLNLVPLPVMMANRYLHISQVGIWVLLASLTGLAYRSLTRWRLMRSLAFCLMAGWLVFLCYKTWEATRVWRNSYTLWTDTLNKNFYDGIAHYNLGLRFQNDQQINRAGHHFLISTLINPKYHNGLSGLGAYYFQRGRPELALRKLYAATNASPDSDVIANNLGKVLAEMGDGPRALFMFLKATYLNPDNIGAFNNIAILYFRAGQIDSSQEISRLMIQRFPDSWDGYFRLGLCLEAKGDLPGALQAWEESERRVGADKAMSAEIQSRLNRVRHKLSSLAQPGSFPGGS